jgi:hypothetical protein
MFKPPCLLGLQVAPTPVLFHRAARPFTPRIPRLVTCPGLWHRYMPESGNRHDGTFTRWIAGLSAAPHPCYPGSPSIGSGSYRQDRCSGLPLCRRGSTTPLCISRLHLGSLALRPAGLLNSLKEPLSGNSVLQVTFYNSLQLRG